MAYDKNTMRSKSFNGIGYAVVPKTIALFTTNAQRAILLTT